MGCADVALPLPTPLFLPSFARCSCPTVFGSRRLHYRVRQRGEGGAARDGTKREKYFNPFVVITSSSPLSLFGFLSFRPHTHTHTHTHTHRHTHRRPSPVAVCLTPSARAEGPPRGQRGGGRVGLCNVPLLGRDGQQQQRQQQQQQHKGDDGRRPCRGPARHAARAQSKQREREREREGQRWGKSQGKREKERER